MRIRCAAYNLHNRTITGQWLKGCTHAHVHEGSINYIPPLETEWLFIIIIIIILLHRPYLKWKQSLVIKLGRLQNAVFVHMYRFTCVYYNTCRCDLTVTADSSPEGGGPSDLVIVPGLDLKSWWEHERVGQHRSRLHSSSSRWSWPILL